MSPALSFDEATHTYALDGENLISVTQLIDSCGLIVGKEWFSEDAAMRGTAVHLALHLLDEGTLDPETVDPRISPYLAAYERFVRDMRLETYLSEKPLASIAHRYAGTLDRLGWMNGELSLIDFKTGPYHQWMDLQLELYHRLIWENSGELGLQAEPIRNRYVVQLGDDGGYTVHAPKTSRQSVAKLAVNLIEINHFRNGRIK